MSLMKNHHSLSLLAAISAVAAACYLCTISIVWVMTLCILGPMVLGCVLRRFSDDCGCIDEFEDAAWRND